MRKLWMCTDFRGHWPVGTAAVILAETQDDAELKLRARLATLGLPQDGECLTVAPLPDDDVVVLCDGNY